MIYHPIIFAIWPILFLYSHNINQMPFRDIEVPFLVMFASGVVLAVLASISRHRQTIGIVISVLLFFSFSYGHFYGALAGILPRGFLKSGTLIPVFIWLGLLAVILFFIITRRTKALSTTRFLNAIGIILIAMPLLSIGGYHLRASRQPSLATVFDEPMTGFARPDTIRDIYYFIFDRYPNTSTLRNTYGFNNDEFIDFLRSKNFYVAEKSHANYVKTALSLSATLNMHPINSLEKSIGPDSDDWRPVHEMLQDYKVWRLLKSQGYRFLHFGSWWEPTRKNRFADMNFNLAPVRECLMRLYETTILYPFYQDDPGTRRFLDYNDHELHYNRIRYEFDKLAEIPRMREPTFVFAHILVPHPPFVFDSTGEFLPLEKACQRTDEVNFVNQVKFVNTKIRMLVDTIINSSPVKPIIIIQSDEGPYPNRYRDDEKFFRWRSATKTELRQKMGILNALYLPNVGDSLLYPTMTPINTFRHIFNNYFHTNLPFFADKSYVFEDGVHLYTFIDVTAKIKE
jgi:hypothetical protein